jgi:N-acetylglucosamine-6-sulfatase
VGAASLWYASLTGSYYNDSINENGKDLTFGHEPNDYSTDVLRNRAIRFIKDQAGATEPFFMLIATKAPHGQGADGVKGPAVPSPAHQHDFMDVELPRHPAYNEQDVSVKPPLRIPGPEWKRGDEKAYRAALQSLQSVDDLVEAVVDALRDAQKLDNTTVTYTSDNGFIYGDPGREGRTLHMRVR